MGSWSTLLEASQSIWLDPPGNVVVGTMHHSIRIQLSRSSVDEVNAGTPYL